MSNQHRFVRLLLAAALASAGASGAQADSVADFYKGKTITFLVGFGAGGNYGVNAQIMSDHMPKYLPGKPNIIVQYMAGAGGTRAANYMYQVAPKDGTLLGFMSEMLAIGQLLQPTAVKYDAAKIGWIGRFSTVNPVFAVRADTPVQSFNDLKAHEIPIGTSGKGSQGYIIPVMMNALLGTRWKVIVGYSGIRDQALAMERGELQALSTAWVGWKLNFMEMIEQKKVRLLVQVGLERESEIPNVPLLTDFARSDSERQILRFISSGSPIGRSLTSPPEIPAERIAALRSAFDKTVKDEEFLAAAKKAKLDLNPAPGDVVEQVIRQTLATPPDLVEQARKIIGTAN